MPTQRRLLRRSQRRSPPRPARRASSARRASARREMFSLTRGLFENVWVRQTHRSRLVERHNRNLGTVPPSSANTISSGIVKVRMLNPRGRPPGAPSPRRPASVQIKTHSLPSGRGCAPRRQRSQAPAPPTAWGDARGRDNPTPEQSPSPSAGSKASAWRATSGDRGPSPSAQGLSGARLPISDRGPLLPTARLEEIDLLAAPRRDVQGYRGLLWTSRYRSSAQRSPKTTGQPCSRCS